MRDTQLRYGKDPVLACLVVVCLSAPALAEDAWESWIASFLSHNVESISAIPSHPESQELLHEALVEFIRLGKAEPCTALLELSLELPESNLGLYSLQEYLAREPAYTPRLWSVIERRPDSRLARFALERLLSSGDADAVCEQAMHLYAGHPLGWYAHLKLADFREDSDDMVSASALRFDCALQQIETLGNVDRGVLDKLIAGLSAGSTPLSTTLCIAARDAPTWVQSLLLRHAKEKFQTGAEESEAGMERFLAEAHDAFEQGEFARFEEQLTDFLSALESLPRTMERHLLLAEGSVLLTMLASRGAPARVAEILYRLRDRMSGARLSLLHTLEKEKVSDIAPYWLLWYMCHYDKDWRTEFAVLNAFPLSQADRAAQRKLLMRKAELMARKYRNYSGAAHAAAQAGEAMGTTEEEVTLREGWYWYLADNHDRAREVLRAIADSNGVGGKALYLSALSALHAGDHAAARQHLARLRADDGDAPLRERAEFLDGFVCLRAGDWISAMRAFERFEGAHTNSPLRARAEALAAGLRQLQDGRTGSLRENPNVLLLSLDTVRADVVGAYGCGECITPNIDALAARGVRFARATAPSSWTKPSHASLFSGTYPSVHEAGDDADRIRWRGKSLAELFKEHGYVTVGIAAAPPLAGRYGFARGFDFYDEHFFVLDRLHNLFLRRRLEPAIRGDHIEVLNAFEGYTGPDMVAHAVDLLEPLEDSGRPWLLFLNLFDAHSDYEPPWRLAEDELETHFGIHDDGVSAWYQRREAYIGRTQPADMEHLKALYRLDVQHVDEQVGQLLDYLRLSNELENTVIVLFSDHGEEFGEHGSVLHAHSLYEEVLHIPLIMAGPRIPSSAVVSDRVSLVDIAPTLLSLQRWDVPCVMQGRNIIPSANESGTATVFAELTREDHDLQAILQGDWKLIVDVMKGNERLFNLRFDPTEQEDLLSTNHALGKELVRALRQFGEYNAATIRRFPAIESSEGVHLEQLDSLGYFP